MRYIIILAILFSNFNVFAQRSNDIGKIALHVVLPEEYSPNFENLGRNELRKIKSKILSITAKNGVAGVGLGDFVIYPVLNIYDEEVLRGGLERQTIIRAEFSLFIQQISNGQVYGEATIDIEGFGSDRSRALKKAISQINIRDRAWKEMIITSKQKIVDYYIARCDDILLEAEGYSKTRDYDEAIATLMQVPVEVAGCYQTVVAKTVEYYDYKIELECQESIAAAKVAKAQDNWEVAAGYMYGILPHFKCYDNAMVLLKDIEDHRCAVSLGAAKAAWARGEDGAGEAAMHLGQIATDSKCAEEANALSAEVRGRLEALELREWELQYEKYNREQKMREDVVSHAIDISDRNQTMRENNQEHRQDMERDQALRDDNLDNRRMDLEESSQDHRQDMQRNQADRDDRLANREMDYKQGRGADLQELKMKEATKVAQAKYKAKGKKKTYITYQEIVKKKKK